MTNLNDLASASVKDLFDAYARVLNELRQRGVVRSTNNPAADDVEFLVAKALRLKVAGRANTGFDATDSEGHRYQIKARRITPHNPSRQLSSLRGLEEGKQPFDYLAGVLFSEDFSVFRTAVVPFDVVKENSKFVRHVNGWRFSLRDSLRQQRGVKDITEIVRRAV